MTASSMTLKREASRAFPPAEAVVHAGGGARPSSKRAPRARRMRFSQRNARAVRSIQGSSGAGVPFLDFEEPPSPGLVAREADFRGDRRTRRSSKPAAARASLRAPRRLGTSATARGDASERRASRRRRIDAWPGPGLEGRGGRGRRRGDPRAARTPPAPRQGASRPTRRSIFICAALQIAGSASVAHSSQKSRSSSKRGSSLREEAGTKTAGSSGGGSHARVAKREADHNKEQLASAHARRARRSLRKRGKNARQNRRRSRRGEATAAELAEQSETKLNVRAR